MGNVPTLLELQSCNTLSTLALNAVSCVLVWTKDLLQTTKRVDGLVDLGVDILEHLLLSPVSMISEAS